MNKPADWIPTVSSPRTASSPVIDPLSITSELAETSYVPQRNASKPKIVKCKKRTGEPKIFPMVVVEELHFRKLQPRCSFWRSL